MKSMTCKQLGGACDLMFQTETFEEIAELSKNHGMEMFRADDEPHLEAMKRMRKLIQLPDAMQEWFKNKQQDFEALKED